MPRKSKSYAEYMELADDKGLVFTGAELPRSVFTQTTWRCKYCGKSMKKAYRSVKEAPKGCSCQTNAKPISAYYELAQQLGIEFLPKEGQFPRNSKVKTQWRGPNGVIVEACYHEIGYGRISDAMRYRLGILSPEKLEAWANKPVKKKKKELPSEEQPPDKVVTSLTAEEIKHKVQELRKRLRA